MTTNGGQMGDWDISRDAPYFGIIPDAPSTFVWLTRPSATWLATKEPAGSTASTTRATWRSGRSEQAHFIGRTSSPSHLFWPAMPHFSGRKVPSQVFVHGFITVNNGEDEQSRGTGLDPLKYLKLGMNPSGCATTSPPSCQQLGRGRRLQPRRLHRARQPRTWSASSSTLPRAGRLPCPGARRPVGGRLARRARRC